MVVSPVIIKRRYNQIIVSMITERKQPARKIYFLIGYSEELLSCLLNCAVKLEIQTVASKSDVIFKRI